MARPSSRTLFLVCVAVTVGLYQIPGARLWLGRPLVWLATYAHEVGHGVTAWAMGADWTAVTVRVDGSGVAHWEGSLSPIRRALVSAGGLVGPAVASLGCFVAARRARSTQLALGVMGLASLGIAGLSATPFTFGVAVAVGLVCGALSTWGGDGARALLTFVAIQLALSVYSSSDYLFVDATSQGLPSDVSNMARLLGGPYWLWGIVCGVASAIVVVLGFWVALTDRPSSPSPPPP